MIGYRIKELRKEKDITQKELATFLGLTPKMIYFYEKEERFPPHDIILKLSDIFNVSKD
ncbi:helix-turn-helix transcriptional regulator, partial [Clostridioides difficile]|uniref:helix-turn-helix domain-containing protein n=1 Tax=Clostridioides difficile TaxID=1496 RepID=UPI0029C4B338